MTRARSLLLLLALAACDHDKEGRPGTTADAGIALRRFEGCDDLRSYVVDATVETLVSYRYGYGWYAEDAEGDGEDGGSPTDYSTTNVQEEGVDEPDMVKTDGDYIYVVQDQSLFVVDTWPADESSLASRLTLSGYPYSMFLHDDTLVVFSYDYDGSFDDGYGGTRIDLIDVSDRADPAVVRSVEVAGWFADARMVDGHVYAVLNSWMQLPDGAWSLAWDDSLGLPVLDGSESDAEREAAAEVARGILRPYVTDIIDATPLEDLLPVWRDQVAGEDTAPTEVMYGCTDLYRPADTARLATLDLVHVDLNAPLATAPLTATGLMADGWVVYASQDNLYVGSTSWWWWWGWGDLDLKTQIHQFKLGDEPTYLASGEVPGWLLDQFSMSEYDGYLRVATSNVDWWWTGGDDGEEGSRISVLQRQGDALNEVGHVSGIAPGEWIYASRMMGDKGYLVTYQQVDPLFTIDLSDPTAPVVAGELTLPGYSSYLHPIDEDHLLAVGMAGTDEGDITGLDVSVFDVSDFANPALAWQYELGADSGETWSWSEALWDHHAFTFHNDVLSIPVYTYTYASSGEDYSYDWFSGLVVLSVDPEVGIEEIGKVDHADLARDSDCPYDGGCEGYAWMRRGVYIEDWLYSVSNYGIKVTELMDPGDPVAKVPFYAAE